jgi:hypothetical protein
LFSEADPRFELEYVYREQTNMMVLVWTGQS